MAAEGRAERAWTAWFRELFPPPAGPGALGIGDDAAVLPPDARPLVVTCDPVVEGVHFDAGTAPADVAAKAVRRNLADLAAMGATPAWLVVSALLPPAMPDAARRALFEGLAAEAKAFGCVVVGGDLGTTPGPCTLTVTALGHLEARALTRAAARAGDTLHVGGPLGGAGKGRHLRPRPPLELGRWLADRDDVGGVLDVSDGLLLDLATMLAAAGGLGAVVDAAAVPVHEDARVLAGGDAAAALERALTDGEDHELLFTLRPGAAAALADAPLPAACRRPIGEIVAEPGLWLRHPDGRREPLQPAGWEARWSAGPDRGDAR